MIVLFHTLSLFFFLKQAGKLEDRREGERLLRGGEKAGGEGGGEQPKGRGVKKRLNIRQGCER